MQQEAFEKYLPEMAELFVAPQEFRAQMDYLKKNNYDVIGFEDIKNIQRYKKPIIISFDDGYKNNFLEAYPILKEYNFPASIFLATNFIDKENYLSEADIKKMCDLIQFESHTVSHPDLRQLTQTELEFEFSESQKIIEALTGHKSTSFAYPSGYFNLQVIAILKKYYDYAVTTQSGLYNTQSDHFQIKRVYVPRGTTLLKFETRLRKGSL